MSRGGMFSCFLLFSMRRRQGHAGGDVGTGAGKMGVARRGLCAATRSVTR